MTHCASVAILTAYDCRIETNAIENAMTIKIVKLSLTVVLAAFSLFVFSVIVLG